MLEALLTLDRSAFLFINSLHWPWLDGVMLILSGKLLWLPFILLFLWLGKRDLGLKGVGYFTLFLVLTLVASDVTSSYLLKNLFLRLRPCREEELRALIHLFGQKCGGKYGFVSSHAANSFALVAFGLWSMRPPKSFLILWLLPVLVSYSRIYLGSHYPGDILGGALVGLAWAALMSWVFRGLRERDAASATPRL
jgi:undecaprenyl-diphosphatase